MKTIAFLLLTALCSAAAAIEVSEKVLVQVADEFGNAARLRIENWQALSRDNRGLSPREQLELVNRFFNRVPFTNDIVHWGVEDYWATPLELLATHGADCEDYSIGKYLTLRAMGMDENHLRITYVKAVELNQAHMVLSYYPTPDAEPLILDNLINDIKPASQRSDLKPVYSFNADGLWLTNLQRQGERLIGNPSRLQHWVSLNERIVDSLR